MVNNSCKNICGVVGDTQIVTLGGLTSLITIKQLYEEYKLTEDKRRNEILSYDIQKNSRYDFIQRSFSGTYEFKPILNCFYQGDNITVSLFFESEHRLSYSIECSSNYPILTINTKYIRADRLTIKDHCCLYSECEFSAKFVKIEKHNIIKKLYSIGIKDNNNFIAEGGIVVKGYHK